MAESYVVGTSILGNITGTSTNNAENSSETDKDLIQAEINKQIAKAKKKLAQLEATYEQLVMEAQKALSFASGVEIALGSLMEATNAATEGTHVGTSQFIAAVISAQQKCHTIVQALQSLVPSGGGVTSINISASGDAANRISVTPEIMHAVSMIESANHYAIDLSKTLVPEMQSMAQEATDIETATAKMNGMAKQLENIGIWLFRSAQDLSNIYSNYHTAQENAIMRANMIPK